MNADSTACENIDECSDGTNDCHEWAGCTDAELGFTSACQPNTEGTAVDCVQKDEFILGEHTCDELATCADIDFGFECACPAGYNRHGIGFMVMDVSISMNVLRELLSVQITQPVKIMTVSMTVSVLLVTIYQQTETPSVKTSRNALVLMFLPTIVSIPPPVVIPTDLSLAPAKLVLLIQMATKQSAIKSMNALMALTTVTNKLPVQMSTSHVPMTFAILSDSHVNAVLDISLMELLMEMVARICTNVPTELQFAQSTPLSKTLMVVMTATVIPVTKSLPTVTMFAKMPTDVPTMTVVKIHNL